MEKSKEIKKWRGLQEGTGFPNFWKSVKFIHKDSSQNILMKVLFALSLNNIYIYIYIIYIYISLGYSSYRDMSVYILVVFLDTDLSIRFMANAPIIFP